MRRRSASPRLVLACVFGLAVAGSMMTAGTATAASHLVINGSGSSWAGPAIEQWISDVNASGLQVVFNSSGSAQGRSEFKQGLTDFGVSDIQYGLDPFDTNDTAPTNRQFALLPVVAGGTAFPYNLTVAGKQVQNLRLSGLTLAKIFTNQITNWDDPAITADNNGHGFPSIPIIPVVRSDGSGATAIFTRYLDSQYPKIWEPFNGNKTGLTEFYPVPDGSQMVGQNGSDGVINFITSSDGAGSIGFDEYAYALAKKWPVAKVENPGGYYTLPTQFNDAVALTQDQIDTTDVNDPNKYLTQNLDNVYTYTDPRSYVLSSYSYMIIPTGATDATVNSGKRQTLADFLNYSLCGGQSDAGPLGYSPLPLNLVNAAMDQVKKLGTADPAVDVSKVVSTTCNNPTFNGSDPNVNVLAQKDPAPPACDQNGQGPCGAVNQAVANTNPVATKSTAATKSTGTTKKATSAAAGGGAATGSSGSAAGATSGAAAAATSGGAAASTGDAATGGTADAATGGDPATGGGAAVADTSTDSSDSGDSSSASPVETTLASSRSSASGKVLAPIAVLLLVAIVALPALIARRLGSRP